jgi:hypothetical protein
MFVSVADNVVAYGRKQHKAGMLVIRLVKRHEGFYCHQLIVELNSFNGSHVGKYFSFEIMLHN